VSGCQGQVSPKNPKSEERDTSQSWEGPERDCDVLKPRRGIKRRADKPIIFQPELPTRLPTKHSPSQYFTGPTTQSSSTETICSSTSWTRRSDSPARYTKESRTMHCGSLEVSSLHFPSNDYFAKIAPQPMYLELGSVSRKQEVSKSYTNRINR
jgi:hypothetical protein